jgi:hypothetical protein
MIYVREDLRELFARERTVAHFMRIEGQIYKQFPTRRTLKFERGGREFFIKAHLGFGWREILRKLVSLRVPVVGAKAEWRAIQALEAIPVKTMRIAAYGEDGINPATKRSFIVTEALLGVESLEKWAPRFVQRPDTREKLRLKWVLIEQVATIARLLHTNGLNHRDFYLGHLLIDVSRTEMPAPEAAELYLIDLHRMQVRRRTPRRWAVKDVAGVFFSSMDLGLHSSDLFRFMRTYSGKRLRDTLRSDKAFWDRVSSRAIRVYRQQHGREPTLPAFVART